MSYIDRLLLQQREMYARMQSSYVSRVLNTSGDAGNLITVITGPRRAGKSTTALCQLTKGLSAAYINFDDEELAISQDFLSLEATIANVYGKYEILVMDEIQNLAKWELIVNRLQRQGHKLVITGSNAHLLSGELATHLTGRYIPVWILPFSFYEYLKTVSGDQFTSAEYKQYIRTYAETGGYPEVVLGKSNSTEYLNTLLQAILFKDIVRRYNIRSPQTIEDLSLYLISNSAVEYSYSNLSQMVKISINTVKKYLQYLHEAFLFFSIPKFSWKVREQVSSNKKIYIIDTGFFYTHAIRHSLNIGRMYENLVAIHLYREHLYGNIRIYYWKSQQGDEVDFVIQKGSDILRLIQVSIDISNPKTLQREVKGLLKASSELKCDALLLITDEEERIIEADWYGISGKIQVLPLYKYLLNMTPKNL